MRRQWPPLPQCYIVIQLWNSHYEAVYIYTEINAAIELQLDTRLDALTDMLNESLTVLDEGADKLELRVNTSLDMILEKVESLQQQIEQFHPPGSSPDIPAVSCAAILTNNPSAPSGLYTIGTLGNSSTQYCDMTLSCGGVTGGWLRVAQLDMTDSSQQCPSGLLERIDSGIRTCGRTASLLSSPGCSSVIFTVPSNYSQVCGKIIGFQVGSLDTFGETGRGTNPSIDTFYVDGVSLTHGNPRQHIWTFAAGLDEVPSAPHYNCPCTHTPTASQSAPPPAFVGDDYFCDTGSANQYQRIFYPDNPLWDGAGCGPLNTCCSFNNPPWFYKQLPQHTTDDIEMRLCTDQGSPDEDMVVEMVDIYII